MQSAKRIMTMIAIIMTAKTTSAQVPSPVSLQLKIKCEAVTDQKEKYLIFLTLTKLMNTTDEILNSFLTPGPYGQFELTAVPLVGGNRSDDAIIEKFEGAVMEGTQLSASKGKACRIDYNKVFVDIHFSEQVENQPLKVLGINYTKLAVDVTGKSTVINQKNLTFIESNCNNNN